MHECRTPDSGNGTLEMAWKLGSILVRLGNMVAIRDAAGNATLRLSAAQSVTDDPCGHCVPRGERGSCCKPGECGRTAQSNANRGA